eukprot:TRINITY_DN1558_c0_g1_i3.p1 TRINITY_DN1558_c0_g1~~TRINITY_DN1558_c0_g1_i3.p1  ORF type:complete len:189 (-),score=36.43 TRINITY_DN1558_c0_g1_i3:49-615(-)
MFTSEGLERSVATMILGRYILFKESHRYMKDDAGILSILAYGSDPALNFFDRSLITGEKEPALLIDALTAILFSSEITIQKIDQLVKSKNMYIVGSFPGLVRTDLHANMSIAMKIIEYLGTAFIGHTEEEIGYNEACILVSKAARSRRVSYIDDRLIGRKSFDGVEELLQQHGQWLMQFMEDHIKKWR